MDHCNRYKEKILWYYLQDKLEIEEVVAVQYHLSVCPVCREELRRMRKLSDDLLNMEEEEVAVLRPFTRSKVCFSVAAACLLVLMITGGYYFIHVPLPHQEYPAERKIPPVYDALDSVVLKQDSILIKQDSSKKK